MVLSKKKARTKAGCRNPLRAGTKKPAISGLSKNQGEQDLRNYYGSPQQAARRS